MDDSLPPDFAQPDPPQAMSWILQLRQRLSSPAPRRLAAGSSRAAAVLVPLYVEAGALWVLLTHRSASLAKHRNQIAFPGGTLETGETAWQAALREAQEEVGLIPGAVLPLGQLDELESTTGFRVTPFVGGLPAGFELRINPDEIADTFRVPLAAFANPKLIEDRTVRLDGKQRVMRVYHVGTRQIWGVTARILQNLLQRLGLEATEELEV